MGVPVPPPAIEHTGRVLFNPTAPWEASEVDLVIGVDAFMRHYDDRYRSVFQSPFRVPPDLLPERPPAPAWVPPKELLLPSGWQEVQAGRKVVMYDASKFEGTPVNFPDLGVSETDAYGNTGWRSEGEYAAVLLTSKLEPSLRLLALAATGLHLSSHACHWWTPALNLSNLLEKASHLNGIPALCGSLCHGSLAGSNEFNLLAEMAPAVADGEAVPAGSVEAPAAVRAGGGGEHGAAAEWLSGVLLPPVEMAWRPPPLLRPLREGEWRLKMSHPHVFGIGPFHPAHFLISTPRSASQDRWPALHLSNVHRSQGCHLAADFMLTHP